MKKIFGFILFITLFLLSNSTFAADNIEKIIRESNINRGAVSVSVKDTVTSKTIYEHNSFCPINPASTQKLITLAASIDTLGEDYKFTTSLYKTTNNELFFKLSGDPFLSSKDLKTLLTTAKSKNIVEPKAVYIDDYVLDSEYWGEGWQWDDDLNPLMPKFGAYNLDNNLLKIIIKPTTENSPAEVYSEAFYPIGFVNLVTTSQDGNSITISHNSTISANLIEVNGKVKKYMTQYIPVNNIKRYFRLRLEEAFNDTKVFYYGKIYQKPLPSEKVYLVEKIEHPIQDAITGILQDSNNMMAETVFKLAGGKYLNQTGSINAATKMLNDFCNKKGLNAKDIRIVDGSGVSKNNLMTADFMTNFLIVESKQNNFEGFKSAMAFPGKGTMSNRMLYFGENLKVKTGTLSNVSAIAGYIKTRQGNNLVFDIMINDPKSNSSQKKSLEELIIRSIYMNY